MTTRRLVIFDFDGTLVRAREASWKLFQQTNRAFALGIDRPEDFYALFRRNFFAALADVCPGDADRARRATKHFQDLLRREYTPDLVPGIADVIRRLARTHTLVVLSSNTMQSVRRTLERHGLASCFAHAFTGDVEPDKTRGIRRLLADPTYAAGSNAHAGAAGQRAPHDDVVLVTDTVGDIREALAAGIHAIGVVWGMHSREELASAGAEFVALWPQELLTYVLRRPAAARDDSAVTE